MFMGHYQHQLDSKGRVAVPAQYRKDLGTGSVIGISPDDRLTIWPAQEWAEVAERFRRTATTPAEERRYIRVLFSNARELELDAQGRILLSPEHRQFAGIDQTAVFVGVGTCVEVLGSDRWEGEMSSLTPAEFTSLHDSVAAASAAEPQS
jgi:transcriptional regulator MraZ